MQLEAESLAQKFKQALFIWLLQLPSQVRKLTLDEFINKYDGDINKYLVHFVSLTHSELIEIVLFLY